MAVLVVEGMVRLVGEVRETEPSSAGCGEQKWNGGRQDADPTFLLYLENKSGKHGS